MGLRALLLANVTLKLRASEQVGVVVDFGVCGVLLSSPRITYLCP